MDLLWFDRVCHLSPREALAEALEQNSTLTVLDLGVNYIGSEGGKAWCLARMVRKERA